MKKIYCLFGVFLVALPFLFGQTITLPGMTEVTTIGANDLLWVWLDPAGANATRKIKASNLLKRTAGCSLVVGSDGGTPLVDADLSQGRQCQVPMVGTLVEIIVGADGGTPNIQVGRYRPNGASSVNLLSGVLATGASGALVCAKGSTGGTSTINGATSCSGTVTIQNTTLAQGDWIYLVSGTAGGTAKRVSVAVTWYE